MRTTLVNSLEILTFFVRFWRSSTENQRRASRLSRLINFMHLSHDLLTQAGEELRTSQPRKLIAGAEHYFCIIRWSECVELRASQTCWSKAQSPNREFLFKWLKDLLNSFKGLLKSLKRTFKVTLRVFLNGF